MLTAQEREAAFRADLTALLAKHGAELEITDDGEPYGMQRGVARITMPTTRNAAGEIISDFVEFDL